MTATPESNSASPLADIMRRNVVELFNSDDDAQRRTLVDEFYHPDAGFHDAEGSSHGRDAITAKVAALHAESAGLTFSVTVEPAVIEDLGRISWRLSPPAGPAVVSGMDIALFRDGRIASLYTFLDQ